MKNFIKKLIEKFAPKVKEEISELAKKAIEMLKFRVGNYDHTEKLNIVVDFVMSKIKLPLWLKPFKWVIKKVIKETAEGLIEEAKEKIEGI
jgi:hypothetical protein